MSADKLRILPAESASVGVALDEERLREMHRLKTGALLQASVMMGAACGHISATAWTALSAYGAALGLAFQVVDDILDVTQDSTTLGKTAGKDVASQKATYPSIVGLERSRHIAKRLTNRAFDALKVFPGQATALEALATYLLNRDR